jgi:ABC-type Mn2+/Zn2+ transport system ATPase subunit
MTKSQYRLDIRDATVAYNRVPAIHHLNLTIEGGHCVALMGPNGAGKTTLLKTIAGLLAVETGEITFHGLGLKCVANEIAYLPQREQVDWDFPITVRGLVELGCYVGLGWWRRFGEAECRTVDQAIATMHLESLAHRQISALSGGQQQRAFLARSLAQKAKIFLLDEPFSGLDRPSQENLARTMRDLATAGYLVIASHHDLKNAADFFDQVIFLNGELIAFGDSKRVFTEENIARTFNTEVFAGKEPPAHQHYH